MTSAVLLGGGAGASYAISSRTLTSSAVTQSGGGGDVGICQSRHQACSANASGVAGLGMGLAIGAGGVATCTLEWLHRRRGSLTKSGQLTSPIPVQIGKEAALAITSPAACATSAGRSPVGIQFGLGSSEGQETEREEEETVWGDYCLLYPDIPVWERINGNFKMAVAAPRATWRPVRKRGSLIVASAVSGTASGALEVPPQEEEEDDEEEETVARIGTVVRKTNETDVEVNITLDGTGISNCDTGIAFLDHMLDQLASHGLFDVMVRAEGDTHIDDHHSNEDIALALGTALAKALGDRKGIYRFGDFTAPLDEALVHVTLDLSGRPHLSCNLKIPTERVGTYDTQLVEHFFQSVVNTSGMTLHIRQLAGTNSHHIIEATFKAFARALRQATEVDLRRGAAVPSSKGVLSRF